MTPELEQFLKKQGKPMSVPGYLLTDPPEGKIFIIGEYQALQEDCRKRTEDEEMSRAAEAFVHFRDATHIDLLGDLVDRGQQKLDQIFDSLKVPIMELPFPPVYEDDLSSYVPRFGVENKNFPFSWEWVHEKKSEMVYHGGKLYHRKCFMQLKTNKNLRF